MFLPRTGHGFAIDVFDEQWFFDPSGRILNQTDPGPYDPCWCRSGKKFRFCHEARQTQPIVTRAEFIRAWEEAADLELCLAPQAPSECSSTIVRAHTVQRMGGGLRAIADGGEVYGLEPHPYFFQKNNMRVVPQRIGLRKASTFRGFCGAHDGELFKPVEHYSFAATSEQLLLLNFRTVAKRLFTKTVTVRHAPHMFEYDRGMPSDAQRQFFAVQHRDSINAQIQLENIRQLKALYDGWIITKNPRGVNALVAYFSGEPFFLCAELAAPRGDFGGQPITHPPVPAHICCYSVALKGRWAFVISWVDANTAAEQLCHSLLRRPDDQKAALVLRFVLEHVDNAFLAPRWWETLTAIERDSVCDTWTRRMHPHYIYGPAAISNPLSVVTPTTYDGSAIIGTWYGAPND